MFPAEVPILTTPRLRLRAMTEDDVDAIFAIFADREVMRYQISPPMATVAEAYTLWAYTQGDFLNRSAIRWVIVRREDDRLLGTCRLFHFSEQNRRAELGYVLARPYWGRGYISEALTAVVACAFTTLALHRLEVDIDPRNTASVRTAARLGFVEEGLLRERWIVDGEISDSLMMGLLQSAWQRANSE